MIHQKDFHVAVIGGGMCGLACTVYLGRAGIKVDVFESAPRFGEVGAGVNLGPNALRALDEMDLTEAVMAHADHKVADQRGFRFVSELPGLEHILDYEALPEDAGLGIHRAAFLDSLVEHIDPAIIHLNKRCTSISRNDSKQVIHFKDGTIFEADVVLGADGIRSTVRQAVSDDPESMQRVVFTRTVAYRALLLWEDIKRAGVMLELSEWPHCIVGVDKHIITFPMKEGKMINVVVFRTDHSVSAGSVQIPVDKWVTPAAKQEILDAYEDSDVEVQKLLSLIPNSSKWSIHTVDPPLGSYVKGHIALVGDAAHAMLPHLGAGVGQGLEDAHVLCKLLTHPETALANLQDVLRVYDRIRRPRANLVLERSAMAGELYESLRNSDNSDNSGIIQSLRIQLPERWAIVHHHDLGAELQRAVEMLRNDGTFR